MAETSQAKITRCVETAPVRAAAASLHLDQLIILQRALQVAGFGPVGTQPGVDLGRRGQDHRHGLGMDPPDHAVRCTRQEGEELMIAGAGRPR